MFSSLCCQDFKYHCDAFDCNNSLQCSVSPDCSRLQPPVSPCDTSSRLCSAILPELRVSGPWCRPDMGSCKFVCTAGSVTPHVLSDRVRPSESDRRDDADHVVVFAAVSAPRTYNNNKKNKLHTFSCSEQDAMQPRSCLPQSRLLC